MYQYSGPGSQQVLDKFGVSWETYMASQGYVVVCVDGRGTGGRVRNLPKALSESRCQRSQRPSGNRPVLRTQPYVDKNRIGIWAGVMAAT
mgnify:CR=1 FL=1